jgi:hypothetical protein
VLPNYLLTSSSTTTTTTSQAAAADSTIDFDLMAAAAQLKAMLGRDEGGNCDEDAYCDDEGCLL